MYRGPKAPATCVALGGPKNQFIFAGSWDRNVWSWNVTSQKLARTYVGHSDFVKAVTCAYLGDKHILVSGGADKKIIVWDMETGVRLHTLQDTTVAMLAVQDLVVDPVQSTNDEICLVSASSDPHIRRWKIRLDAAEKIIEDDPGAPGSSRHSIFEHATSVYKLVFAGAGDEIDLWTSSADGTTKCLSRMRNFAMEETYEHGDCVRAVAITDQWVLTAGRDEDVKVWDRASGKLHLALQGHYDEITDLVILRSTKSLPERVCSVSIDGTVRTWPLDHKGLDETKDRQEQEVDLAAAAKGPKQPNPGGSMLTAEEETELAELMTDDDD